ncbi:hypothetical protein PTE30175_04465 [Pandoraea terrae]|uniref:DUF1484 domain-containing protein n=1 Tax=Pandoraea terrae TaxID=1537710 RepID=A0A5E4YKC7_9BURK|nr:DUF1484 family protein [Pandoraea terrae]VVE48845.1 hypothetical protein PTE30175_04465 [Pandoraea terrae]
MPHHSHSEFTSQLSLAEQTSLLTSLGQHLPDDESSLNDKTRDIYARLCAVSSTVRETVSNASDDLLQLNDAIDALLDLLDNGARVPVSSAKLHCLIAPLKGRLDAVSREMSALV